MAKSRRIGSAYLDLSVRSKQFRADLASAEKRTSRTARHFRGAAKSMSSILPAGLGAAAGFGALAAALTGTMRAAVGAVRAYAATEASLSRVVGLVGVSQRQVTAWSRDITRMAGDVGRAPRELADALFFATSAGLRGARAMDAVRESARAAAGGLGETADVMRAVAAAMNSWGISASEATDTLTATVREGSLEASELAASIGQVAPLAAAMGVELREVGAWIAHLTRGGLSASEAITQLRGVIKSFARPAREAERALAGYGLTAEELRETIQDRGLYAAVTEVTAAIGENEAALAEIFGEIEAFSAVLSVAGDGAEQMTTILGAMADTTGATDAAFGAFATSLQGRWQLVRGSLQGIRETIGAVLAEEVVLPALTGLQRWLDENRDVLLIGIRSWEEVLQAFALSAQTILSAVFSGQTFVALGRRGAAGLVEGVHEELQRSLPGSVLSYIMQFVSGQSFVAALQQVTGAGGGQQEAPFAHISSAFAEAGEVWRQLVASWEAQAAVQQAAASAQEEAASAQRETAAVQQEAAAAAETAAEAQTAAAVRPPPGARLRLTDPASQRWYRRMEARRRTIPDSFSPAVTRGQSPYEREVTEWEAAMAELIERAAAARVALRSAMDEGLVSGEGIRLLRGVGDELVRQLVIGAGQRPRPRVPQLMPPHLAHVDPSGREQTAALLAAVRSGRVAAGEGQRFAAGLTPGALEAQRRAWQEQELRARAAEEDRQRQPLSPMMQQMTAVVEGALTPIRALPGIWDTALGEEATAVMGAIASHAGGAFRELRRQADAGGLWDRVEEVMVEQAGLLQTEHLPAFYQHIGSEIRAMDIPGMYDDATQALVAGVSAWQDKMVEANPLQALVPVVEELGSAMRVVADGMLRLQPVAWMSRLITPAAEAIRDALEVILALLLGARRDYLAEIQRGMAEGTIAVGEGTAFATGLSPEDRMAGERDFGSSIIGQAAGPMSAMGTVVGSMGALAGIDTSSGIESFLSTVETVGSKIGGLGISSGFASGALTAMGPAAMALGPVLQGMMSVLKPLIVDALKPLLGILRIVGKYIGGILAPTFHILGAITKVVGSVFQWLYNNVFKHVGNVIISIYNAIADAINWALGWLGIHVKKAALLGDVDVEAEGSEALDDVGGGGGGDGSTGHFRQQRPIDITINIKDNEIAGDGSFRDLAIRIRDELETLGALNA